jgi:hypothetical protein
MKFMVIHGVPVFFKRIIITQFVLDSGDESIFFTPVEFHAVFKTDCPGDQSGLNCEFFHPGGYLCFRVI